MGVLTGACRLSIGSIYGRPPIIRPASFTTLHGNLRSNIRRVTRARALGFAGAPYSVCERGFLTSCFLPDSSHRIQSDHNLASPLKKRVPVLPGSACVHRTRRKQGRLRGGGWPTLKTPSCVCLRASQGHNSETRARPDPRRRVPHPLNCKGGFFREVAANASANPEKCILSFSCAFVQMKSFARCARSCGRDLSVPKTPSGPPDGR